MKHDYKCQNCGKTATINLQNLWFKWDIEKNGDFINRKEWEGDENSFYCDDCYV